MSGRLRAVFPEPVQVPSAVFPVFAPISRPEMSLMASASNVSTATKPIRQEAETQTLPIPQAESEQDENSITLGKPKGASQPVPRLMTFREPMEQPQSDPVFAAQKPSAAAAATYGGGKTSAQDMLRVEEVALAKSSRPRLPSVQMHFDPEKVEQAVNVLLADSMHN